MESIFLHAPHRRWNPLSRKWVIVSPHRTARPWQGQLEDTIRSSAVSYDPACYLCPGNTRAGGKQTPQYAATFVFENDYAALNPGVENAGMDVGNAGLLLASTEKGICRVVCFDPRHDLTLATMPVASIRRVVNLWAEQEEELAFSQSVGYVQIFENRGAMMGASNPHPHGQIWATEHIPDEPAGELAAQSDYFRAFNRRLLLDYVEMELVQRERIVAQNSTWVALVPFWAVWPFELILIPLSVAQSFVDMGDPMRDDLAEMLNTVTAGYNMVFDAPFPYSMGFHPSPSDRRAHPGWQFHAHFYPPLLRSASVRKFMVGFELLGSAQRDITPEFAADVLRKAISAGSGRTSL